MSLRLVDPGVAEASEAGLSLLDRRAVTETQMREYLAEKGFGADAVEDTVAAFAARGWLDDRDYASEFLRERALKPGMSRAKLVADMEKRGLDAESVTEGLAALDDADPEWEASNARALLEGKLDSSRRGLNLDDYNDRQKLRAKLWRYGASRGFSSGLVAAVVGELLNDLAED